MPVGLQKRLFVDDHVVAEKRNATRELGQVKKCGIVLEPSLPTDFIPPQGQRGNEGYERALWDKGGESCPFTFLTEKWPFLRNKSSCIRFVHPTQQTGAWNS